MVPGQVLDLYSSSTTWVKLQLSRSAVSWQMDMVEGYASLLDASLSWLERLSRRLPMRGDNSLVAGSFLVSAHLWPLQQDQHILLSLLTLRTVAQWLECELVREVNCLN